ncbi:MAG: TonB-dependent receptor plug domain-containing protein [Verrucomicrobia bacterium]|nr:TonB-dependent receptor plug domain-containing protein [Verrucomicrobiota bacterium]
MRHPHAALPLLLTLLSAAKLPAQSIPPTTGDQPLVLSEFRVDTTRDRGYVATNSTTGTRLNLEIKAIPLPIEVITREFIDDIGAVDIKEALEYSAGIVQDQVATANNFLFSPSGTGAAGSLSRDTTTVNIRGLNTRSFLRNGFRQDTVTDVINLDRLEVARGPQSLLYGVASLGGVVALTPKYPRATPQTDLRFGTGSNDFYRAEVYHTGPLWKSKTDNRFVNYGAGLVYQTLSSRSDFDDRTRVLFTPAVEFRPFRDTTVFVDVEYGRFESEGTGFQDLADSSAGNVRHPLTRQLIAENLNEWNETRMVARDVFGRDRLYRWSGPDTYSKDDYFNGTVEVTQKLLPGLTAVLGGNYSDRRNERCTISGSVQRTTTAGPAVAPTSPGRWTPLGPDPVSPNLTQWKSVGYGWGYAETHKYIRQARVDLNYEFTLFGQRQSLLLGRTDQVVKQSDLSTTQVTSNTPGSPTQGFLPFAAPEYIRYAGEQFRPFRDSVFTEWDTGRYAVYQGRWWKDRLTTIGGWRNERYLVRSYYSSFVKQDPTQPDTALANWILPSTPDPASLVNAAGQARIVNGYRFGAVPQRDDTFTLGVNAALTRDLNLYAVSAGGIFPNTGQRDGAANPFKPERTQSRELGAKFDLWKNSGGRARISATVAYFEVDRENAIYNFAFAPQPRSNNQATLRAGFTGNGVATGTGPGAYSVHNSGYTTFQTNQPVTYLLPVSYIAPADLNHPRVTGAPQQSGFLLVDYASLGTSANDPLRRAMEAAAADPATNTALQGATVGTGATALNANNGYALNRNSDVAYDDRSKGIDAQIYLNLTDNLSTVITYTHLIQAVTGGFEIVDQPSSTEYDSWWRYLRYTTDDARAVSLDESKATVNKVGAIGRRTSDVPRNVWAVWNNYKFTTGRLRGFEASLGVTINGPRHGEQVIDNGLRDRSNDENRRYRPQIPMEYKINAAFAYRGDLFGRRWNIRLNLTNLLDDQKMVSTNTSTLFMNPATGALVTSTTPGAERITVSNRAIRYFEPRSFRLSISTRL